LFVAWFREVIAMQECKLHRCGASALLLLLAVCAGGQAGTAQESALSAPEGIAFADLDTAGPVAISPDGSRLVFAGVDSSGRSKLWVRSLVQADARALPGTEDARFPFWSPDGKHIAFFANSKLEKISADGGAAQTLCDAPEGSGGSWGNPSDGGAGTVIFARHHTGGLWQVPAVGGKPVQVTQLDAAHRQLSHSQPEFLPDGRHFLYLALCQRTDDDGIFVGDTSNPPNEQSHHRLMGGTAHVSFAPPGYLLFLKDDQLMAQAFDTERLELRGSAKSIGEHVGHGPNSRTADFSVCSRTLIWRSLADAPRQLAWFRRSGESKGEQQATGPYFNPALSPDGKRIALSKLESLSPPAGNVWLADLGLRLVSQLTSGSGAQLLPIWSPDGQRIAFAKVNPAEFGLYTQRSDATGKEELLLKTSGMAVPMDWSHDGRYLLYAQLDTETKWDLWVLPMANGKTPLAIARTQFNEGDGRISPDGRWLAYWSDESGRWEVYVKPFSTDSKVSRQRPWSISTGGGTWPRWSADGRELCFKAPDGKMMAVAIDSGKRFRAGAPRVLFDPHDLDPDNMTYEVSPDAERFLVSRKLEATPGRPIHLRYNWQDEIQPK